MMDTFMLYDIDFNFSEYFISKVNLVLQISLFLHRKMQAGTTDKYLVKNDRESDLMKN